MKLYTDEGNLDWVLNNTVSILFIDNYSLQLTKFIARFFHSRSDQIPVDEMLS